MAPCMCSIVPPHLLASMAQSQNQQCQELAASTIGTTKHLHSHRKDLFAEKLVRRTPGSDDQDPPSAPSIIPNKLLERLAQAEDVDESVKTSAAKSLATTQEIRSQRQAALFAQTPATKAAPAPSFHRSVYDNQHQEDDRLEKPPSQVQTTTLPGKLLRAEGQAPSQDKSANEAYDNCQKVLDFYLKEFHYVSLDNANMPVVSSVHYGRNYGNAAWSDTVQQMIYGDGNELIYNFTACIDVIGHEMTHAITAHNSQLQYEGESGALNEHISDVFGIMVKQVAENTTAEQSDWLIGEGCLMPSVKGVALRNMKAPGTAYNDPNLGGDIQPDNYTKVSAHQAQHRDSYEGDNGGVHILSGIPNRAFVLSALALGGYSWEKAGQIWWKTVSAHRIPPTCRFIQFADETVEVAGELYGDDAAKKVRAAWDGVGVKRRH